MPQGRPRNDRGLPSPPLVSVTGSPPLPTDILRYPSSTIHPEDPGSQLVECESDSDKGVVRRRRLPRRVCISWSHICMGFDTGCRPPTTSTNGIRGLSRSCTRNGGNNSMARARVNVGGGEGRVHQPTCPFPAGGAVPVHPTSSPRQAQMSPFLFPSRSSLAHAAPNGAVAQVLSGHKGRPHHGGLIKRGMMWVVKFLSGPVG
jgi:hypothetical protein